MVSRHPLAGRTIARMNGAGNKILVLDMRGAPVRPAPADARAIHRAPHLDYDQMMVIGDPHTAGTAADSPVMDVRRSTGSCATVAVWVRRMLFAAELTLS